MKEQVKTKKEIEKARKVSFGLYIIVLGIIISFFFLPVGLFLIFCGIIGFSLEKYDNYKFFKNPPSYIPITCPYCHTSHEVLPDAKTFVCPECKSRVLVENGEGRKI